WLGQACDASEPAWDAVSAMQVAEAQRQRAVAQLKNSRIAMLPTISLEAAAEYDLDGQRRNVSRDFEYSVGVNVSSPIYQGGAYGARQRAASHALASAEAARDDARNTLRSEFEQGRQQVGALQRLQSSLISRAQMMTRTRDLYRVQYTDLGTRTLLDLLDAETELHEAELLAANAEHDLRRLYVTCLHNSGKTRERFGIDASALRQE